MLGDMIQKAFGAPVFLSQRAAAFLLCTRALGGRDRLASHVFHLLLSTLASVEFQIQLQTPRQLRDLRLLSGASCLKSFCLVLSSYFSDSSLGASSTVILRLRSYILPHHLYRRLAHARLSHPRDCHVAGRGPGVLDGRAATSRRRLLQTLIILAPFINPLSVSI